MLKIKDLQKDLNLGELGGNITNYSSNIYICDAIFEIADENVSIYNVEILDFISNYPEDVEDIINECGWDGVGRDLIRAGQCAMMRNNESDLYECLEDIIIYYALDYLYKSYDIKEISEDEYNELTHLLLEVDHNNELIDIENIVDELFINED